MSYEFYKVVHIFSIIALITSSLLLPFCSLYLKELKKWVFSLHGMSSIVSFIAGFGLIAKTNLPLKFTPSYWTGTGLLLFFLFSVLFALILKKRSATTLSFKQIFIGIFPTIFLGGWSVLSAPMFFIQPYWLSAKIAGWLFLAFSPLILSSLQKIKSCFKTSLIQNILAYYGVILIISYKVIAQAVYKIPF